MAVMLVVRQRRILPRVEEGAKKYDDKKNSLVVIVFVAVGNG
jgi:hypothetical protein